MDLARSGCKQRWARLVFTVLIAACVITVLIRNPWFRPGPSVEIHLADGAIQTVSLREMKRLALVERAGTYQNQYGNWRDHGVYKGVLVSDLLGDVSYEAVEIVAADGYRTALPRSLIESDEYPVVLAFSLNGVDVPEWEDGFRLTILPSDGDISNAEYGVESAGSYWIKTVMAIHVLSGIEQNLR